MLLFIHLEHTISISSSKISIHLMLLFIFENDYISDISWIFQYISCYCLSHSAHFRILISKISIHLMLLFIEKEFYSSNKELVFQYISCYCLSAFRIGQGSHSLISIHLMLLFISIENTAISNARNFNTSHVTVYLYERGFVDFADIFQYISCYCLSLILSLYKPMLYHFNTSHVTVYQ